MPGMSGGGKDVAPQLSRQRELETLNAELRALDAEPSGDEQEHEIAMSSQELEGAKEADAHEKDNSCGRYLIVTFPNSDQEYRVDLSRTMDAGDVGRNFSPRLGNKPARDVLDHNAPGKRKRKTSKLVETGPAEDIGEGWTYKTYQRRNCATEGQTDTYWFSPVLKKKFRSRQEISRFLELYRHARGALADDPVVLGMIDKREGGRLEAIAWDQFRASTKQHPWENRVRARLQEAKYTGDTDAMVSKVLAKLPCPDGHGGFKRMTKYVLDDVVHRLTKEEEEGVPFDDPQVPIPKKRCVDQEEIPRKISLPPIGEFYYWLVALVHFKRLHGHIDVACHLHTDKEIRLHAFAEDLKQRYSKNKIDPRTLSPSELAALASIGYKFPSFVRIHIYTWSKRIEQLKSFKAKNGHCNVTLRNSDEFPGLFAHLGKYRSEWRQKRKAENYNGPLTDAKEEELTALGFCLSETLRGAALTFYERVTQLRLFKEKHGHCNPMPSQSDSEFPGLAQWCYSIQKYMKKKRAGEGGPLSDEKEQELRDIGFVFTSEDAAAKRKKEEDEAAAREAADRPKVLGIVAAAFQSVVAEVDTEASSATKIRNWTRDRALFNLRGREDLAWSGVSVYDMAGTMAFTFKAKSENLKQRAAGCISLPPIGEFNYWLFALVHFKKMHGHIDVACHLETDKEMRLLVFAEDLKQRYNENKIDPSTLSPSELAALASIGYDFPNNEKRKYTWSDS